ncbi:MAG: DUF3179 domain-containing protein [Bacteroidetes bacterium]|nr:DUF3179 domain-containing protein [Bacteroidota bacterium]
MKKLFYLGLIGLLLFEISNVYVIMPMPGSQQFNSLPLAYFLYSFRWLFRMAFAIALALGLLRSEWKNKLIIAGVLTLLVAILYIINFVMAADGMFKQPKTIRMLDVKANKVDKNRLVIGVVQGDKARAYPIQLLGYHHFVYDDIDGNDILITYCTVCRTGRVYSPTVDGKKAQFRLVGMDHFNAMLEDASTKSWWQQATGEAVTGPLKGKQLPEIYSTQTSLAAWEKMYPHTLIMQPNSEFKDKYDTSLRYESGKSRKELTGSNPKSGADKSWVVGLKSHGKSKYIDWNELKRKRIVQVQLNQSNVFVVLLSDNKSFFAYENPYSAMPKLINNTLVIDADTENCYTIIDWRAKTYTYQLNGHGINDSQNLKPLKAYQEFLHSWKHFSQQ